MLDKHKQATRKKNKRGNAEAHDAEAEEEERGRRGSAGDGVVTEKLERVADRQQQASHATSLPMSYSKAAAMKTRNLQQKTPQQSHASTKSRDLEQRVSVPKSSSSRLSSSPYSSSPSSSSSSSASSASLTPTVQTTSVGRVANTHEVNVLIVHESTDDVAASTNIGAANNEDALFRFPRRNKRRSKGSNASEGRSTTSGDERHGLTTPDGFPQLRKNESARKGDGADVLVHSQPPSPRRPDHHYRRRAAPGGMMSRAADPSAFDRAVKARYWRYLFDNLNRAVDELYLTCEGDREAVEVEEVIMVLQGAQRDFEALISRFEVEASFEGAPPGLAPNVAWEIRRATQPQPSPTLQTHSPLPSHGPVARSVSASPQRRYESASHSASVSRSQPSSEKRWHRSHSQKELGSISIASEEETAAYLRHMAETTRASSLMESHRESSRHVLSESAPHGPVDGCESSQTVALDQGSYLHSQLLEDVPVSSPIHAQASIPDPLNASIASIASGISLSDVDGRQPGTGVFLHQRLSSPSRRKSSRETEMELREKFRRAELIRLQKEHERSLKHQQQNEKLRKARSRRRQKDMQKKTSMVASLEKKMKKAEEKRESYLQDIVRKNREEEMKLREVAFIKTLKEDERKQKALERINDEQMRLEAHEEHRRKMNRDRATEITEKMEAAQKRRERMEEERIEKLKKQSDNWKKRVESIASERRSRSRPTSAGTSRKPGAITAASPTLSANPRTTSAMPSAVTAHGHNHSPQHRTRSRSQSQPTSLVSPARHQRPSSQPSTATKQGNQGKTMKRCHSMESDALLSPTDGAGRTRSCGESKAASAARLPQSTPPSEKQATECALVTSNRGNEDPHHEQIAPVDPVMARNEETRQRLRGKLRELRRRLDRERDRSALTSLRDVCTNQRLVKFHVSFEALSGSDRQPLDDIENLVQQFSKALTNKRSPICAHSNPTEAECALVVDIAASSLSLWGSQALSAHFTLRKGAVLSGSLIKSIATIAVATTDLVARFLRGLRCEAADESHNAGSQESHDEPVAVDGSDWERLVSVKGTRFLKQMFVAGAATPFVDALVAALAATATVASTSSPKVDAALSALRKFHVEDAPAGKNLAGDGDGDGDTFGDVGSMDLDAVVNAIEGKTGGRLNKTKNNNNQEEQGEGSAVTNGSKKKKSKKHHTGGKGKKSQKKKKSKGGNRASSNKSASSDQHLPQAAPPQSLVSAAPSAAESPHSREEKMLSEHLWTLIGACARMVSTFTHGIAGISTRAGAIRPMDVDDLRNEGTSLEMMAECILSQCIWGDVMRACEQSVLLHPITPSAMAAASLLCNLLATILRVEDEDLAKQALDLFSISNFGGLFSLLTKCTPPPLTARDETPPEHRRKMQFYLDIGGNICAGLVAIARRNPPLFQEICENEESMLPLSHFLSHTLHNASESAHHVSSALQCLQCVFYLCRLVPSYKSRILGAEASSMLLHICNLPITFFATEQYRCLMFDALVAATLACPESLAVLVEQVSLDLIKDHVARVLSDTNISSSQQSQPLLPAPLQGSLLSPSDCDTALQLFEHAT